MTPNPKSIWQIIYPQVPIHHGVGAGFDQINGLHITVRIRIQNIQTVANWDDYNSALTACIMVGRGMTVVMHG